MSNDGNLSVYNLDDFEADSLESDNDSERTQINCQLNNYKLGKSTRTQKKMSTLTQRLSSAKKNKINELQDKVDELKLKLKEKETENRLLKKVQARQEKELSKFENSKADIPNLFQYHNEEVRILQNRLKQVKEKLSETEAKLKTKDTQFQNIKKELQRLQKIVSDNELIEKESLQQMIKSLKLDLEEKEAANQILSKKLELSTKTHRQEFASEVNRHKETYRKLKNMEQNYEKLEGSYNEIRKMKDKQNIYTMSMARASSRVMVNTNTYPKEDSIASAKSDAKTTPEYSLPSSHASSPPSPSSFSSISPRKSPPEDTTITSTKLTRNSQEIDAIKKEHLLAKLKAIEENKYNTNGNKIETPVFIKHSPKKTENSVAHHSTKTIPSMPEVSINSETLLNPRRTTSARRKSSLSISSNENLLVEVEKPYENVTTSQDNRRKNDLMISLFGKPSIQNEDNMDSILDLNQELSTKKSNRMRGSEVIF